MSHPSELTTETERVRICDKLAAFIERGRTAPRGQWLDLERIIDHWPACRVELRVKPRYDFAGRTDRALP